MILRPHSNTYGAPEGKCKFFKKYIVDCFEDKYSLVEDDLLNFSGKWGIIDEKGLTVVSSLYSYIDFFRNENEFLVASGKFDFEHLGEDYIEYTAKGIKWGIINDNQEIVIPFKYDWIMEMEKNLYAVNIGGLLKYSDEYQDEGWYVNDGIWGFKNSNNEVIVPFEYNSFYNGWGKIKKVIFVQKGYNYFNENEPYDGYDLNGKLVFENITGRIPEKYRHFPGK